MRALRYAVLLGLLLLGGGEPWESPDAPVRPFTVKDLDGRSLSSSDLAGKVAVVDFWATWCGPCIKELPALSAFHASLAGRSDVVFLAFNVTDEPEAARAFAAKHKLPYPVYLADELVGPFEVVIFPTKVVLDLRGKPVVRFRKAGETPLAEIEEKVKQVLSTPPAP